MINQNKKYSKLILLKILPMNGNGNGPGGYCFTL
jgi:hypothetical protein